MQVTVKSARALRMDLLNKSLGVVDSRLQLLGWELPATIKITTCQRASVVAIYYPVWIKHRDNLEDKATSK